MKVSEYIKAKDLNEAYELLREDRKNYIIAGGAWLKLSVKSANKLVSLDALGLDKIVVLGDSIEIGALCTLGQIETNELIKQLYDGILVQAVSSIMGVNIRNIATIGGCVMGKFSFSDIFPVLEVMDTTLVFHKQGEVSLMDFLNNPKFEKDILVKIKIKNNLGKGFFKKVAITALDFSVINIACSKTDGLFSLSVGSTPYIASPCYKAMDYINCLSDINLESIKECANKVVEEIKFSSNNRASKEYREELAKVYISRGIKQVSNYEN
ncbi:MAG: FAD binding domain-containing protein [Tenericutes bacterium]|nr:FAD binding domain-containing protein [Mycoplasmatota bacterium]